MASDLLGIRPYRERSETLERLRSMRLSRIHALKLEGRYGRSEQSNAQIVDLIFRPSVAWETLMRRIDGGETDGE